MAKGQKKSNREAKKPKTAGKKTVSTATSPFQTPVKANTPGKSNPK